MRLPRLAISIVACVVACSNANEPEHDVRSPDIEPKLIRHEASIPGQYIVVLGSQASRRSAARVAIGSWIVDRGTRLATYEHAITGFAARLSEDEAIALSTHPDVAYVEEDIEVLPSVQTPATWGLDRIDQRLRPLDNAYDAVATGLGVNAYIIDSGIRRTHAEFAGRAVHGTSFVVDGNGSVDCNGHGTHVAATIGGTTYGVAKGVRLHAVRVFGCTGGAASSTIISAIDWVTANHIKPAVANMSLGGGISRATDDAVAASIRAGVTYGIAAGNGDILGNGKDACTVSPARVPEALTVGATKSDDQRSRFSNHGPCVDLFAPGEAITSAWIDSDTATKTISGTSMATPHIVGVAALYLERHPEALPAEVATMITLHATPNVVGDARTGSPNLLAHMAFLNSADGAAPSLALEPITSPSTGTIALAASASDDESGIRRVELVIDGRVVAVDDAAPYGATWNTGAEANGAHTIQARAYDLAGNLATTAAQTIVTSNAGMASIGPTAAPTCPTVGAVCSSGRLLEGRAGAGPELAAPNTIGHSCADGTAGSYKKDESIEQLSVRRIDGSNLAPGKTVRIEARVWAYSTASSDQLDLYLANDASALVWTPLATLTPTSAGANTLTASTVLPQGGAYQVLRARLRFGGTAAPCGDGVYDDHDDLVFAVDTTPDTTPPTTTVTSPAAGATLKATVTVYATATDDYEVARVELYANDTLIGTDASSPFSFSWNTRAAPNGTTQLTTRAYDHAGNVGISTAKTVIVDNDLIAPTVAITSPSDGATVTETVTFTADAADHVGVTKVIFYRGSTVIGSDTTAPYSIAWSSRTVVNASYTFTARAYDAAGNTGDATPITLVVGNPNRPPVTAVTSPAANAVLKNTVSLIASATDDPPGVARVEFHVGGVLVATDTAAPWSVNWDSRTLPNGSYTLISRAIDTEGLAADSAPIAITLANDFTPPVASITTPAEGASVTGSVAVTATATDNGGVSYVGMYVDGVRIGAADWTAPYTAAWDSRSVVNGSHLLGCKATDTSTNVGDCAPVGVTVDNRVGPTVSITSPANGAILTSSSFTISAAASDDYKVDRVELYEDDTLLDTKWWVPASFSMMVTVNGPYTYTAKAIDSSGNVTASAPVSITRRALGSPSTSLTAPSSGAVLSGTATLEASASDDGPIWFVDFYAGTTLLCRDHDAPFTCAWDTTTVANGPYTLRSVAWDQSGLRTRSASIAVSIANP
jgi:subtilisin family serine protease